MAHQGDMPEEILERLSRICLAFPETVADDHHPPHRGFLVGKKNFAWYVENELGDGRIGATLRASPGHNHILVATDGERFGLPKYVARHGWVTYYLDLDDREPDWDELQELVTDSYLLQAPRRLARQISARHSRPDAGP
jgi:predicted DNA-binding protein (MmcQ/YjbR family)